MPTTTDRRPAEQGEIDGLMEQAARVAREIALRHPKELALACARADAEMGPGLAAAWVDMIRDGGVDIRATPVAEIVRLLGVEPGETRGPLRRRLARLADLLEQLADTEFDGWMDVADASTQEAA